MSLPPEITDQIIDYLPSTCFLTYEGSVSSTPYARCSLVCRTWLPRARYYLHQHQPLHAHNIKAFLDLLNAPPTIGSIAPYIRFLDLTEASPRSVHHAYEEKWIERVLPDLENLDAVDSVLFRRPRWKYLPTEHRRHLLSKFPAVRSLEIWDTKFQSFDQVIDSICMFDRVERIVLGNLTIAKPSSSDTPVRTPPPRLGSVDFDASTAEYLLAWLLAESTPPTIHTFRVRDLSENDMRPIKYEDGQRIISLLQKLGPVLTHLTIAPGGRTTGEVLRTIELYSRELDLSHNTHLRYLHIDDIRLYADSSTAYWITAALSRLASPHIRELVFTISIDYSVQLGSFGLYNLAELIAQPLFSNLERCQFWIDSNPNTFYDAIRDITERLPEAHTKGILQIKRYKRDGQEEI